MAESNATAVGMCNAVYCGGVANPHLGGGD